ncbi:unnamed protein product [Zymoseptoria tritici ST99CH_1E4]|uniref:Uncharacterized protein n=1 Tax=Zymoseptoria tritici ST99CH_1E4 TaxID=1276532 RepID=A0A2H1HBT2_ZYMTR|nr:unnamed protein product [Zymoseptoria tritici ST99CH_1E4]
MTSTTDLDNQRPIISQCYRLHDLSHLVRDQRYHTERLMAEVSRRKANLLSSRRARPEYISDEDLLRLSNVLDLDAITRSLEDQDRRLEAELGNLLDKMTEYTLDESTGYSRWHHQPGDDAGGGGAAAAALRLAMGLKPHMGFILASGKSGVQASAAIHSSSCDAWMDAAAEPWKSRALQHAGMDNELNERRAAETRFNGTENSAQQDKEVGDGTHDCTWVFLAAESLRRANELVKMRIRPTTIITGYSLAFNAQRGVKVFDRLALPAQAGPTGNDMLCRVPETVAWQTQNGDYPSSWHLLSPSSLSPHRLPHPSLSLLLSITISSVLTKYNDGVFLPSSRLAVYQTTAPHPHPFPHSIHRRRSLRTPTSYKPISPPIRTRPQHHPQENPNETMAPKTALSKPTLDSKAADAKVAAAFRTAQAAHSAASSAATDALHARGLAVKASEDVNAALLEAREARTLAGWAIIAGVVAMWTIVAAGVGVWWCSY